MKFNVPRKLVQKSASVYFDSLQKRWTDTDFLTCYDPAGKTLLAQVGAATARDGFGFATFRDAKGNALFGISDNGVFEKK